MPSIWYKDHILGEKSFIASTATVLGTIVHGLAESFASNEETSREECDAYATKMASEVPEVDSDIVISTYPGMASLLINDYIKDNRPTIVEQAIFTEVKEGIFVGGSCDAFYHDSNKENGMVLDYKTAGTKPRTDTIPFGYKIQALTYAYIYQAMGYKVDRIRIVYVVKPTKTLPERLFVVTHQITEEDWTLISDVLVLIADSLLYCEQNPTAIPLIFKSLKFANQRLSLPSI